MVEDKNAKEKQNNPEKKNKWKGFESLENIQQKTVYWDAFKIKQFDYIFSDEISNFKNSNKWESHDFENFLTYLKDNNKEEDTNLFEDMKKNEFDMSKLEEKNKETLLKKIYNNITKPNKLEFLTNTFKIPTKEIRNYIAQVLWLYNHQDITEKVDQIEFPTIDWKWEKVKLSDIKVDFKTVWDHNKDDILNNIDKIWDLEVLLKYRLPPQLISFYQQFVDENIKESNGKIEHETDDISDIFLPFLLAKYSEKNKDKLKNWKDYEKFIEKAQQDIWKERWWESTLEKSFEDNDWVLEKAKQALFWDIYNEEEKENILKWLRSWKEKSEENDEKLIEQHIKQSNFSKEQENAIIWAHYNVAWNLDDWYTKWQLWEKVWLLKWSWIVDKDWKITKNTSYKKEGTKYEEDLLKKEQIKYLMDNEIIGIRKFFKRKKKSNLADTLWDDWSPETQTNTFEQVWKNTIPWDESVKFKNWATVFVRVWDSTMWWWWSNLVKATVCNINKFKWTYGLKLSWTEFNLWSNEWKIYKQSMNKASLETFVNKFDGWIWKIKTWLSQKDFFQNYMKADNIKSFWQNFVWSLTSWSQLEWNTIEEKMKNSEYIIKLDMTLDRAIKDWNRRKDHKDKWRWRKVTYYSNHVVVEWVQWISSKSHKMSYENFFLFLNEKSNETKMVRPVNKEKYIKIAEDSPQAKWAFDRRWLRIWNKRYNFKGTSVMAVIWTIQRIIKSHEAETKRKVDLQTVELTHDILNSWIMKVPIVKSIYSELRNHSAIELDDAVWKEIIRHTEELKNTKWPWWWRQAELIMERFLWKKDWKPRDPENEPFTSSTKLRRKAAWYLYFCLKERKHPYFHIKLKALEWEWRWIRVLIWKKHQQNYLKCLKGKQEALKLDPANQHLQREIATFEMRYLHWVLDNDTSFKSMYWSNFKTHVELATLYDTQDTWRIKKWKESWDQLAIFVDQQAQFNDMLTKNKVQESIWMMQAMTDRISQKDKSFSSMYWLMTWAVLSWVYQYHTDKYQRQVLQKAANFASYPLMAAVWTHDWPAKVLALIDYLCEKKWIPKLSSIKEIWSIEKLNKNLMFENYAQKWANTSEWVQKWWELYWTQITQILSNNSMDPTKSSIIHSPNSLMKLKHDIDSWKEKVDSLVQWWFEMIFGEIYNDDLNEKNITPQETALDTTDPQWVWWIWNLKRWQFLDWFMRIEEGWFDGDTRWKRDTTWLWTNLETAVQRMNSWTNSSNWEYVYEFVLRKYHTRFKDKVHSYDSRSEIIDLIQNWSKQNLHAKLREDFILNYGGEHLLTLPNEVENTIREFADYFYQHRRYFPKKKVESIFWKTKKDLNNILARQNMVAKKNKQDMWEH